MSAEVYYRNLAETVIRAWENPSCSGDRIVQFLDFGLTYGPQPDDWPNRLTSAWVAGRMPSPCERDSKGKPEWPCHENLQVMVEHCHAYLKETA